MTDTPCLVDEKAPTCGETGTPALKGYRLRNNLFLFDRCQNTTEHGYGEFNPPVKQEEVGTFGFARPIVIQVVAHRFQHILPRYLKRECSAFWTEETDAFVLDGPPRDVVEVTIS